MNEPIKIENTDIMNIYRESENILNDIQNIIETSQRQAYHAVDTILSQRNWLIGYRIAEEELKGENRAEYGTNVIKQLSEDLTKLYGKGFTKTNLYNFYSFYKCFPEIFHSLSGKSKYKLYLPTEEELRHEIETQKAMFYLQQKEKQKSFHLFNSSLVII